MAREQLSDKQQQILEFIKRRILDKGYPPAVREICEAVNLRSTSSVHSHLETLERKGYIHRDPTKPRAIEIIDDDFNLARREIINIPVVGTVTAGEPILAVQNIEVLALYSLPVQALKSDLKDSLQSFSCMTSNR